LNLCAPALPWNWLSKECPWAAAGAGGAAAQDEAVRREAARQHLPQPARLLVEHLLVAHLVPGEAVAYSPAQALQFRRRM
jgi:hypothetical protein